MWLRKQKLEFCWVKFFRKQLADGCGIRLNVLAQPILPFRFRDVIRMTYEPRTSVMSCPEALSLLYRQPRFVFYAVFSEVCIFSPCSFRVTK